MTSAVPTAPTPSPAGVAPRPAIRWWIAAVLAVGIAAYGFRYVVLGERAYVPGLAASFSARPWLIWTHALFGPIALIAGIGNLLPALRFPPRWNVHRWLGRSYALAAFMTGVAGLGLSLFAFGGMIPRLGFAILALLTAGATARGYFAIRRGEVRVHREWMLRSYALIFAAVTLRVWLPLLTIGYGGHFLPAYRVVAWLCWVPNVILVEWLLRHRWHPRFRVAPDFRVRGRGAMVSIPQSLGASADS